MNVGFLAKEIIRFFLHTLTFANTTHTTLRIQSARHAHTTRMNMLCGTALCLLSVNIVSGQDQHSNLGPFSEVPRTANPLREPFNFCSKPTPVVVDMDGDGKKDVAV